MNLDDDMYVQENGGETTHETRGAKMGGKRVT